MKIMVFSDIHGSLYYANKLIDRIEVEKPDKLIALGDILYHGPRNPLTKEYDPLKVCELLSKYKEKIIGVRGNCDAEIDIQLLGYNGDQDYIWQDYDHRKYFLTHGHIYTTGDHPELPKGSVFVYGHTHVHQIENIDGITYFNPGSVSLPKNDTKNSYGIITEKKIKIKDLDGNEVLEYIFKDGR
ncbi:MAG: phosphodiesterase [Erysipelotrichaceae bacterium]|nr:phosphodiesterase [Erysipelotrichaceae bacterium]MDD4643190.1 phosphodiesterase [Erysipelotrichaceae bacterium]